MTAHTRQVRALFTYDPRPINRGDDESRFGAGQPGQGKLGGGGQLTIVQEAKLAVCEDSGEPVTYILP